MATEPREAEFVCPFCGRDFEGQEALTDHFEDGHGMTGFS